MDQGAGLLHAKSADWMASAILAFASCAFRPPITRPAARITASLIVSTSPLSATALDGDGTQSLSDAAWDFVEAHDLNSFGVFYALFCASIYASIYLRTGTNNIIMRNGTVFKDNEAVEQPFKRTAEDAAKAAASALRAQEED